jgi:hypothetical protein
MDDTWSNIKFNNRLKIRSLVMATQNALNNQTGTFAINTLTGILTANSTSPITASTVTQYGVVVAGASNLVTSVAPSATSGVPLISGGSSANPSFGTAVVAGGGTGAVTFTAYSLVAAGTTATGVFQSVGTGSSGQVLISGGSSALPAWSTISTNSWLDQTGTTLTLAINTSYTMNAASLITGTLPTTAAYGSTIRVVGKGAGGWKIAQPAGVTIHFSGVNTTTGTGGSLASTLQYDVVDIVCSIANTDWTIMESIGNITIV